MALVKITREDIEAAVDALTPAGKGATCWSKRLATTDEGTELCFVVGWSNESGYTQDEIDADGFGDGGYYGGGPTDSPVCIRAKIAYQSHRNRMQSDFDMDWNMPYNVKDDKANGIYAGDVYDTAEMVVNEPSQWGRIAKLFNKDAQNIWDAYGETGELDLMESFNKGKKKKCSMLKKKESLTRRAEALEDLDKGAAEMVAGLQELINKYTRGGAKIRLELSSTPGQDYVDLYYGDNKTPDYKVPVGSTSNAYILRDVYLKVIDCYF